MKNVGRMSFFVRWGVFLTRRGRKVLATRIVIKQDISIILHHYYNCEGLSLAVLQFYYLMKLVPINLRDSLQPEVKTLKNYILSHNKNLKSEPVSFEARTKDIEHASQIIPPIIHKSQQFSIFAKRKSTQYSGYMQNNLAKSKEISFQGEEKKPEMRKPMRSYEINMKNIMKLRRKRSVQASTRAPTQREDHHLYKYNDRSAEGVSVELNNIEKQHQTNIKKLLHNVIARNQRQAHCRYLHPSCLTQCEEGSSELEKSLISNRYSYFKKYQQQSYQSQRQRYPNESHVSYQSPTIGKNRSKTNRLKGKRKLLDPIPPESDTVSKTLHEKRDLELSGWQVSLLPEEKRQSPLLLEPFQEISCNFETSN